MALTPEQRAEKWRRVGMRVARAGGSEDDLRKAMGRDPDVNRWIEEGFRKRRKRESIKRFVLSGRRAQGESG